jgi:2-dehydro-3-deoxyphosphogluconate aldolase / (4S)-4-hydroxy-2-oxoglutarate aldolase
MHSEKLQFLLQNPIVPVYFNADVDTSISVLQSSYDAGLRVFEFTHRGHNAPEVYKELRAYQEAKCPDMRLGIGTIVKATTAEIYFKAGVDFMVQPGTTAEVAKVCSEASVFWIPGVLSPTEIYAALELGAMIVKVFPASVLGSSYIKALRGPMPQLPIMVTGGVEPSLEKILEWKNAGANVYGLGSQLFSNLKDISVFKSQIKSLLENLKQ